ncbi:N-acetylmuramoyl-L-alanine amidase [Lysinibacillus sp. 54212]|uniref:N-acetylmuramoyl-L-alanine amidase n=1 Tax=Lysinibacillus sp. 54212 TaxID=3119829 RepID=UPI002FC648AA
MITISPGHWAVGSGAIGIIDEVAEARKVVSRVVSILKKNKIVVQEVQDNQSQNQKQNLRYLIHQHNSTDRRLDVSVHFNSVAKRINHPLGCEVYYVNPSIKSFAQQVSAAIASAGKLKNRGAKRTTDFAFLNKTTKPALLIEVCFVNSSQDVRLYQKNYKAICEAIANTLRQYVK